MCMRSLYPCRRREGKTAGCEAVWGRIVSPDVSTIRMINAPLICQYTDLLSLEMAPFRFLRMCLRGGLRDRFIFMLGASSEFPQCLIDSFHTTMLYSAACLLRCACIMSVDEQLHPAERVRSGGWGGGRGKGEGGWLRSF
jgi:hypothetical protein